MRRKTAIAGTEVFELHLLGAPGGRPLRPADAGGAGREGRRTSEGLFWLRDPLVVSLCVLI